jgi:hypothetical protein
MVVTKSLKIEGFISTNWMPEWQKAEADLLKLYKVLILNKYNLFWI